MWQAASPIATRSCSSPATIAALTSSRRRMPSATSPRVTRARPWRARPIISRSVSPTARAIFTLSSAWAWARLGSPSSNRQKAASRSSSQARSVQWGASSRSRRARPSQPLPTTSSPRNAQQSHPIQTAMRAAETLSPRAEVCAIGALARVEDDVGEIEPPGGKPQALERLGIFLGL